MTLEIMKVLGKNNYLIQNFSNLSADGGKALIIGIGGAGIQKNSIDLNQSLKGALDLVPYLNTAAGKIDYVMLMQKDSADLNPEDVALVSKVIYDLQSDYDGFVVISGSDAITYVASAVAFALNN